MTMQTQAISKLRYTHDAMIDVIIARPDISQGELATLFNYSETWVSILLNSDAFKVALREKTRELTDPILVADLELRLKGLCHLAAAITAEKLEATKDPKLALKALEVTAKALGFGAKETPSPQSTGVAAVILVPVRAPNTKEWLSSYQPKPIEGEVLKRAPD